MTVAVAGQILALAGLAILGLLFSRATRLDLTLSCLICGFLAGLALGYVDFDTGIRAHNLKDLVFFIILPVLIFEAAWHIKPALLRRWLMPVLLLATVGVLISCFVTAALVYWGIGHPTGFPWMAALLTGAMLAATDPIAVISQLRSLNAPEDLATLFEGESLLNDASAVVLFSLLLSLATAGGDLEQQGALGVFLKVFFGGLAAGVCCGLLSAAVARLLADSASTVLLMVFAAFGSFYLAEHLLHVSGILAVMVTALIARAALPATEDSAAQSIALTWDWLGLLFNSILFVIMGLVITVDMFREQWLAMLIAIAAALLARAAAVAACGLATQASRNAISFAWQVLLFWGGLRGAIALALVLALPVELEYWYTVQSMVFGVVLFSMLAQATTSKALIARLGSDSD